MRDHCSVTNDHNWCVKSPFHTRSVCRRDTRMKEGTCRTALCPGFPYGIWEEPILQGGKAVEARIVTSLRGINMSRSGGLTWPSGSRGFCTIPSRWGIVDSRLWFLVAVANVCGDLTMCSAGRFTWMIIIWARLLLCEMGAHLSTLLRLRWAEVMELVPGFGPGGGTPAFCSGPLY